MLSKEEVTQRLKKFDMPNIADVYGEPPPMPQAAVLVPLFFRDGELRVLLTVRSSKLRTHSGEVAFPGGRKDEEDATLLDTALRESWEEIGLPREKVDVVAQGVPFMTRIEALVTPFVGFIKDDFAPVPNEHEVDEVFSMPLLDFLSSENHTGTEVEFAGRNIYVHTFTYTENNMTFRPFGITAFICIIVANIVFDRPPPFPLDLDYNSEDPPFILLKWYQNMLTRYSVQKLESKL